MFDRTFRVAEGLGSTNSDAVGWARKDEHGIPSREHVPSLDNEHGAPSREHSVPSRDNR